MDGERRAIKGIIIIIIGLIALYALGVYDSHRSLNSLQLRVVDVTFDGNIIVEVYNPTNYAYTIKRLDVRLDAGDNLIGSASLEQQVSIAPGERKEIVMNAYIGIGGLINAILSNAETVTVYVDIEAQPSLYVIPFPAVRTELQVSSP